MKSTGYMEFSLPPSLSGLTGVPQNRDTSISTKSKGSVQPPTSAGSPLRHRLEQLRQAAQITAYTRVLSQTERLRDQIKTWFESMTPGQRSRRFSIEEVEVLAGLVGKHGGHAAHHQIAQALRSAGFSPCRDWTVAGRNRRFWKFIGDAQ
jgi:hypothetical protein